MEKAKLIEKLKKEKNLISPSYRTIASVNLSEAELDLILTSLTAPVPDGKVTDAEIARQILNT